MNFTIENGVLTLKPVGRIDTISAPKADVEFHEIMGANPHEKLVLDFNELVYISSAGLRVVLRLRKEDKTLAITNASPEVYDVLYITGFTEMIPVTKK